MICLSAKVGILGEQQYGKGKLKSAAFKIIFIGVQRIAKLCMPIPSIPEQQQISKILTSIDKKIESEENKKQALESLFKSLLSFLMTGKLRVKDLEIPV